MTCIHYYYIGLNDKDTHTQKYKYSTYVKMLRNILLKYDVLAYTFYKVTGSWRNELENTIKLELSDDYLTNDCLEELKEVFNQECILHIRLASDNILV